jgi:hypothetical protein
VRETVKQKPSQAQKMRQQKNEEFVYQEVIPTVALQKLLHVPKYGEPQRGESGQRQQGRKVLEKDL